MGNVISVFTLSGKLSVQETVESNTKEITLNAGFFLVKVGGRSYKVIVK